MKPALMVTFGTLYREPTQAEIEATLARTRARNPKACNQCGKPFNAARKVRGFIAYQNANRAGMVESVYPLCRRCAHHLKDHPLTANQGTAVDAHYAAMTALLEPGGTA